MISVKSYEFNDTIIPCITALHVAGALPHILIHINTLKCLGVDTSCTFQKGFITVKVNTGTDCLVARPSLLLKSELSGIRNISFCCRLASSKDQPESFLRTVLDPYPTSFFNTVFAIMLHSAGCDSLNYPKQRHYL